MKKEMASGHHQAKLRHVMNHTQADSKVSEETFSLLVSSVKDYGIFLIDPQGNILSWNAGAEKIKGYSAEEAIGKNFTMFYTDADIARKHPQNELRLALEQGKYEEEGWRVRKDGTKFWANVVITALKDKEGKHVGFAKVTRDLTDRKRNEDLLKMAYADLEKRVLDRTRELTRINEELQEAVRTRDEFLSIASHELRTPLTPLKLQIQNFITNVKKKTIRDLPDERLERMGNTCDRALNRLTSLIDNLLDVSRINSGKLRLNYEDVNLKELSEDILERYKQEIHTSGSVVTFDVKENIVGSFDRLRIEQVFLNLLTNALKYGNKQPINISLSQKNSYVIMTFKDTGMGIPSSYFERIFERFERVSENSNIGGLGLGLFITKQIVEAHGGTIAVDSSEGQGATFTVQLPLKKEV